MNKKKMLLVIDAQNDFITGSLAVKDAKDKMLALSDYINKNANEYEYIVFTSDWHPLDHMSFVPNKGQWPVHCVAHTWGAALMKELTDAVINVNKDLIVLKKGMKTEKEEYSVMECDNSKIELINLVEDGITDIDICGIANEYCVNNSVKDIAQNEVISDLAKIHVLFDYVAAIADENVLLDTCKELGVDVYCTKTN